MNGGKPYQGRPSWQDNARPGTHPGYGSDGSVLTGTSLDQISALTLRDIVRELGMQDLPPGKLSGVKRYFLSHGLGEILHGLYGALSAPPSYSEQISEVIEALGLDVSSTDPGIALAIGMLHAIGDSADRQTKEFQELAARYRAGFTDQR